jgi:hypothetical protein
MTFAEAAQEWLRNVEVNRGRADNRDGLDKEVCR